jgi:uncharacterized membrane protein affecting hemolysin expression
VEVSLSLDTSIHSSDLTQATQVVQTDISASNIDLAFSINGFVILDFNNFQAHISKQFHYLLIMMMMMMMIIIIIIIIIITYLTAPNGLSPGGSGYNACT